VGQRFRRYFTSLEGLAAALALIVAVVLAPEPFKIPIAFLCGIPLVVRALQASTDRASHRGMTDSIRGDTRAAQRADSWHRMTVFVKFDEPRSPSKWTQGVLVRTRNRAYLRYFWKPWRAHLEVPIADLKLGLGRYSDSSDLPWLKPTLYFVIPGSSAEETWNFAVPTVEATQFRRLFATPSESADR
jgi:hypothetical protein